MTDRDDARDSKGWSVFWSLLKKTEPIPDRYDVEWHGPFVIPRPRVWHPSHYMLYGGHLYGAMEIGWSTVNATWKIESDELSFEGRASVTGSGDAEQLWGQAMPQLTRRLRAAIANPSAFNRRVQRLLPLEARTGRIVRKWSWPKGARPPLSRRELEALEDACRQGADVAARASLTAAEYLELAGVMYDAAYPELRALAPREKHSAKADSRHGGMLDLAPDDPHAFRDWFTSRAWSGCHPWEIVFGHPHGILFSPLLAEDGSWRYNLAVDSLGLYLRAAKMAIALGALGVPFALHDREVVISALRGLDDIEVGSGYGQLALDQLRETRPEGVERVCWDPIPELMPITSTQDRRVNYVLQTGSPAGWQEHADDHHLQIGGSGSR